MSDDVDPEIQVHHWQQTPAEQEEFLERVLRRQEAILERQRKGLPTAQEAFASMVKNEIAPRLRELGFKGSVQKFRLPSETHLLALDLQRSAWNDIVEVRFTINVAAAIINSVTRVGEMGLTPTTFTHEERLGFLARGNDYWWNVPAEGPTLAIANEVLHDVREFGIPWLRRQLESDFSVPWIGEHRRN